MNQLLQKGRKSNLLDISTFPDSTVPVIITCGQSNLGTGVTSVASDLEAEYKQVYSNVKFFKYNSADVRNLQFASMSHLDNTTYQTPDQNGTYSLQFYLYPELATLLGRDLYVIHHGVGDTGLALEWKPTATLGDRYNELVFKTNSVKNAITDYGLTPDFKFMLMVFGEKDSRVEANANAYETNLTNFINNFRTATGLSTLPVVILLVNNEGQDAAVNPLTYVATVRTAMANVAGALSNVYTVESVGAAMQADEIHYTAAGEKTLKDRIVSCVNTNNLLD